MGKNKSDGTKKSGLHLTSSITTLLVRLFWNEKNTELPEMPERKGHII